MNTEVFAPRIDDPVLITGGAGFIGTNLAARLLDLGHEVIVFDNMSRRGVAENLRWLSRRGGSRLRTCLADTREARALHDAVQRAGSVFHFAAQVAVTSSLEDPLNDFEINLRGTLNLLEAIRHARRRIPLVFTSTNKVYGGLPDIAMSTTATRYQPEDDEVRRHGIDETRPLDFCSPYGCSKGAADQYILDYARSFGIPAVVLRMSCIYGPHQCGNEDQGWVAHFLLRAMQGRPITIYGDGLQVRDILYVDDLVDALLMCGEDRESLRGRAFNMGGGPDNTISLQELLTEIAALHGRLPRVLREGWREADQRWFVADTRRFGAATGWRPRVGAKEGIERLFRWLAQESAEEEIATVGAHAA
ncbi:MAG TPA: NAD-dependent epimerase/dehydratase family protein [Rhodanobacteraceae bacterium]|nr:NAD-dependent epimerase/dehydratase family protein [Rhodanobacteraceae bacterium]